jgi:glyoxylase-like metal-dependent hydrolase (beta-lactamase superfamily II)
MTPIAQEVETPHYSFEVVPTPGHSEDHLCLFERKNRWLFTGDLYLASYLRYLRDDENIYEIMNSLRKLIDLHPALLFCNHRGFIADGEKQLAKKLSFL